MKPLSSILCAALLIRIFVAMAFQNVIAPDEVFQFLEQAHRLVFGQGVVPWEFQVGLRNWLIPLMLAVPMALVHLLTPAALPGLMLVRLLLCAASLGIVWSAAKWGEQFAGNRGIWTAGLLAAVWPDLWIMAPHPLEEVLAADAFVPAVYLAGYTSAPRGVAAAALLLGLAFTLRLQLAPAIAIAGIYLCGRDPKRWLLALPIAVIPVLAAGLLDWFTWGEAFRSFWLNIYLNVGLGVAAKAFGSSPPGFFAYILALDWLWSLPVIVFLGALAARKIPLPAILAVVIILTHSLISHKEYRFIFPAIALAVPLAGAGLAAVKTRRQLVLAGILLIGPCFSPWSSFMLRLHTESYAAFNNLAVQPPCLIAIGSWEKSFLPLDDLLPAGTRLTSLQPSNDPPPDAIVTTADGYVSPAGYALVRCYAGTWIPLSAQPRPHFCVWRHAPATCSRLPASPLEFPFPAAAKPFIIRDRLLDHS